MRRVAFSVLLFSALLAGCASSHGGHADGPAALLGVANEGSAPLEASWNLTRGGAISLVSVTVEPGETVERLVELPDVGAWNLTLTWGAASRFDAPFDTADCGHGTFHLVLGIAGESAAPRELNRECH